MRHLKKLKEDRGGAFYQADARAGRSLIPLLNSNPPQHRNSMAYYSLGTDPGRSYLVGFLKRRPL